MRRLCPIHHAGFAAYYSPQDDVIRIPAPSTFHSREDYYHSLYHEMIHASGHSSRLDREGVTQQARFGSERYSKEELVAELGAAFLSNEAGILDSVRFENSAAYLGSWINKLENDPRMIVSAASQAQKASDFVLGIEHKESLQECQTSPEGMPLTWAREHGIDTRIPGFAHHDQDGDGVSTLMEWKHGTTANRPAFPTARALAMKGISLNTLAHPRFDCARLHPSRRRVLAAPGFGTAANQRTFPDPLGFARPFAPSSPRPDTRLRAARIGGSICRQQWGSRPLPAPGHCDRLPPSGEPDRRRQLFGSQMGGMSGQVMDKEPMLLRFPNPAKHMDSGAGSGRAFRIAHRVNDHLVFADGHFLGVVIQRKSALLKLVPRGRHTEQRHPFCDWRSMVPGHPGRPWRTRAWIALVCILRGGESLPRPSGRTQTSSPFPTGLASRAHSPRPRPAPLPGSGRDESAAGPSELSARPIERRGLFPTSPTKLVSQM